MVMTTKADDMLTLVEQFGWGRHACPGRFFAANEIKMIVATYILTYDIRLPDGVTERYPNLSFGSSVCISLFSFLVSRCHGGASH